jgi:hypothetical protein
MKKVLYVIIGLIVVYLIMCMIGPKEGVIERTTVVNQKPELVKAQLVDFKFFNEKWSPWTPKDPNMKITYSGELGKPGYKYDWEGNDSVGVGAMEFAGISGDTVKQKLIFKDWGMISDVYLIAKPEGENTQVTWKMVMPMGFIWRGFGLFMNAEKQMGRDFNNGIANLKRELEALSSEQDVHYTVDELEWPAVTYVGTKKETVELAQLPAFFGKNWEPIMKEVEKNKQKVESAPSAIYYAFDNKTYVSEVAAVFKVPNGVKIKGYETHTFPATKVLKLEYWGDPSKSMMAYEVLELHMSGLGATKLAVIEESITDPGMEKDTAKWLTNIYYVLKK